MIVQNTKNHDIAITFENNHQLNNDRQIDVPSDFGVFKSTK